MPAIGSSLSCNPLKSILPARLSGAFAGLILVLAASVAVAASDKAPLRLSAEDVKAEYPAAVRKMVGAYSEVPGYPKGGKSVMLIVYRGTDLVCIAPIKTSPKDKNDCWHYDDAPAPLQTVVNEKDAEFAAK
jgi:hypothetical protein